jgi:hypothetical protein
MKKELDLLCHAIIVVHVLVKNFTASYSQKHVLAVEYR